MANLNTAHFVSGGGTTMAHVAALANTRKLGDIRSTLVIASKATDDEGKELGAITKAKILGIPHVVVDPKDSREILAATRKHAIRVVIGNGYTPVIPLEVVHAYSQDGNSGYNQHPGGLRVDRKDFGGKGMYGTRVTATAMFYHLATGRELGTHTSVESSVHRLTQELDDGELVGVSHLAITPELDRYQTQSGLLDPSGEVVLSPALGSLIVGVQQMLLILEHENVAGVMRMLGEGGIPSRHPIYDMSLGLDPARLAWAKEQATRLYPKG